MSILGGIMRPVKAVTEKAAKAQQIKSVKLKVKFGKKKTSPSTLTSDQK